MTSSRSAPTPAPKGRISSSSGTVRAWTITSAPKSRSSPKARKRDHQRGRRTPVHHEPLISYGPSHHAATDRSGEGDPMVHHQVWPPTDVRRIGRGARHLVPVECLRTLSPTSETGLGPGRSPDRL